MMRSRFRFALHAFVMTFLSAAILAALWFFKFDLENIDEPARLAFWTLLAAIYTGIIGFTFAFIGYVPRGRRFALALLLGAIAGFSFCFVALYPRGFFSGPFELPIGLIWPAAAAIGFAFAASSTRYQEGSSLLTFAGIAATVLFVAGVKHGLNLIAEPLDFARYQRLEPVTPRLATPIGKSAAATDPMQCTQSAGPRRLSDAGIAIDSANTVQPLGVYSNVRRNAAGKTFGRRVHLWHVGDELVGYVEEHNGAQQPSRGAIEAVEYDQSAQTLSFKAFFGDGYYSTYHGGINPGNMYGFFAVSQEDCANFLSAYDTVTLTRDFQTIMPGAEKPLTLQDLAAQLRDVYRRNPMPSYPDVASIDEPITVAERFWWPGGTSAATFTAKFDNEAQLNRWLDYTMNVGTADKQLLRLKDVMLARAVDNRNGIASWIAVGPSDLLKAYTQKMLHAYAARDGINYLTYQVLPVTRNN